jgi:hypothetical protein
MCPERIGRSLAIGWTQAHRAPSLLNVPDVDGKYEYEY